MNAAPMLFGLLIGAVIGLLVFSLIGAVALRASIALLNKLLPGSNSHPGIPAMGPEFAPPPAAPVDYHGGDPANPFSAPATLGYAANAPQTRTARALREPSFVHAFGIMFVIALCSTVFNFVKNIVMSASGDQVVEIAGSLVGMVVNFLIASAVIKLMLPTTFGKAFLAYLLAAIMLFGILMCIGLVVVAVMQFTG